MALYAIMLDSQIEKYKDGHPVAKVDSNLAYLESITQLPKRYETEYPKVDYDAVGQPDSAAKDYLILDDNQYETGNIYELIEK